jgi:hypothetical protein
VLPLDVLALLPLTPPPPLPPPTNAGDTVPTVFAQWGAVGLLTNRKFVTFMSSLLIMLPLSALKDLSSLDRTSLLSIVAVIVIVLLILFRAPQVAGGSVFEIDSSQRWTVAAAAAAAALHCPRLTPRAAGGDSSIFPRHRRHRIRLRVPALLLLGFRVPQHPYARSLVQGDM